MKLAEISVRRPVFAVMMSAALLVLGWFSYRDLGLDLMPRTDSPTVNVRAQPARRQRRGDRDHHHQADRGLGQHHQRHRRAALQLEPGQRQLHHHLHARARHRGGDAGRPRQGRHRPLPARHAAARRQQVRSRLVADPHARRLLEPLAQGDHADRRRADQAGARDGAGRRRSAVDGRSPARDPGPARSEPAQRLQPDRAIRSASAIARQNTEIPGGSFIAGPSEISMRTMGRLRSVQEFEKIVLAYKEGSAITLGDVARVTDSNEEVRSQTRLDGENAVSLSIRKQSGTNTVTVVDRVLERARADPGRAAGRHQDQADARPVAVHPQVVRGDPAAPDPRRHPRGRRRLPVHPQPARHDHRRAGDPDLDRRHVPGHARRSASRSTT